MPVKKNDIPQTQRVLILQGGGALGAYEAGVFETLSKQLLSEDKENNTDRSLFDIIAGTSGGAINAAILVSYFRDNKTWNGAAERLFDYWRNNISMDLSKEVDFWIRWWNEEHVNDDDGGGDGSAASYEAARRYYSTKYLLQNGAYRKFPKPNIILDEKIF